MDVNALRNQHRELSVIARQLMLAVQNDSVQQSVGAVRWQLARQLMSHLALEDRIFYPAMLRLADEQARSATMRLQAEIGTLAQDFSAYMYRWSDDRVAREWPQFCAETREILAALAARMGQEERLLYPLAERTEGTPLPMSKAS